MCVFSIWLHDCFLFVHFECKSVERTGESNSNDSLYISATCNWIALVQLWNLAVCAIARMTATVTIQVYWILINRFIYLVTCTLCTTECWWPSLTSSVKWKVAARWLKFLEVLEPDGQKWSKPHVSTLPMQSLFRLKAHVPTMVTLFDLHASELSEVTGKPSTIPLQQSKHILALQYRCCSEWNGIQRCVWSVYEEGCVLSAVTDARRVWFIW